MADLASHALINWILGARALDRTSLGWLVTGALVPDLASRVPRVILNAVVDTGLVTSSTSSVRLVFGLDFPHTPVGVILVAAALALALPFPIVDRPGRAAVGKLLAVGGLIHLAVDLLQRHLVPGYRVLYPFSAEPWELGWIGTETSLAMIPVLLVLALVVTKKDGRPEGRPPDS